MLDVRDACLFKFIFTIFLIFKIYRVYISRKHMRSTFTINSESPSILTKHLPCRPTTNFLSTMCSHVENVHGLECCRYCCRVYLIKYRKIYRSTRHLHDAHHLQCLSVKDVYTYFKMVITSGFRQ